MKHICDENGCRLVSDEEYEKLMKKQQDKEKEDKKKS